MERNLFFFCMFQIAKNSFVRQASSGQYADQLKEFKDDTADYLGETKTSAAMIAYLKRAQAHSMYDFHESLAPK